jgi:hypothetical protein
MTFVAILIALFVALPALAVRYGADSRRDDQGGWPFSSRPRTS